jgi:hypothetical protein
MLDSGFLLAIKLSLLVKMSSRIGQHGQKVGFTPSPCKTWLEPHSTSVVQLFMHICHPVLRAFVCSSPGAGATGRYGASAGFVLDCCWSRYQYQAIGHKLCQNPQNVLFSIEEHMQRLPRVTVGRAVAPQVAHCTSTKSWH